MSEQPFRPRDLVLVDHRGKRRPMFVLLVDGERFIAISGTGSLRDMAGTTVDDRSSEGRYLRFYKPTYFYFARIHIVKATLAYPTSLRCPQELWLQIGAGVEPFMTNALSLMQHNRGVGDPVLDVRPTAKRR